MPGGFPSGISICNGQSVGALTASSKGTTITASGTINTKGGYTQLIASTAFDCCFATIQIVATTAALILVDIAVGATGSEHVILPNIFLGSTAGIGNRASFAIAVPISIKAGTKISAQCQSATASAVCTVSMQLFDGSFSTLPGIAGYDDLGTSLAGSTGTSVTPSASANTLGSGASLIASTAKDYIGLWGSIGMGTISVSYLTNFGTGTTGSGPIIIPNWTQDNINTTGTISGATLPFLPIQIPLGANIWANCQSSGASSVAQMITLYGGYQ